MSDKLSPAQAQVMERIERSGQIEIHGKLIGYGWRMPPGLEMRTIDALRRKAKVKTKIVGVGSFRRMIITATQPANV